MSQMKSKSSIIKKEKKKCRKRQKKHAIPTFEY